jgi:nucleoside-diphosphate-sugar epimerase
MGESLSLSGGDQIRVVRLSNVYGGDFNSENFLSAVLREALRKKRITLWSSLESEKDYVSVEDVTDSLIKIATEGRHTIYNLASGRNVSNRVLMERIRELTSCEIEVAPQAKVGISPPINIERLVHEFGFRPAYIMDDLKGLVELYKGKYATYAL